MSLCATHSDGGDRPNVTSKSRSHSPRALVRPAGHPDYGVPFGQDCLIPLWIATQAVRQQTRTVEFESASQILHEWGLAQNGAHYRRLADGFRRIFASTIFFGTNEATPRAEVWDCGRLHFFEHMRLWFRPESSPRRIVHFNVAAHPTAEWTAQQLREAFPSTTPRDTFFVTATASLAVSSAET